MKPYFENGCCICGSDDMVQVAQCREMPVPAGVIGFIGCHNCQRWEDRLSLHESDGLLADGDWVVLAQGQGNFTSAEERENTLTWVNPDAGNYFRYVWGEVQDTAE